MVEMRGVTKAFGRGNRRRGVFDVDFRAEDGKVAGILGLNGAGKTTLIRALCGIHCCDKGQIFLDGGETPATELELRQNAALVAEQPLLYERLCVIEFLFLAAELYGVPKERRLCAVREAASLCKIRDVLCEKIRVLSKGYKQRVSFAQALIHDPKILVLDEPSGGLDPAQIADMRRLIRKISAKRTVVLCTHIMQEAESLCDSVLILSCGRAAASGTIEELVRRTNSKNFEDAFLSLAGKEERA